MLTEADVLGLMRARLTKTGNGGAGEYAFLTHVRSDAAFDAKRTFDAVAVNLWPSRGLQIDVFEVKVSRSDWLRELSKPEKAEDAHAIGDTFTIVAPADCVKAGELPAGWGLWQIVGDGETKPWKIRATTPAVRFDPTSNPKDRPIRRGFMVAMLRCCPGAIPGGKIPPVSAVELEAARAAGRKEVEDRVVRQKKEAFGNQTRLAKEREMLEEALVDAGLSKHEASPYALVAKAIEIAAAVKGSQAKLRLTYVRNELQAALEAIDAIEGATG